MFGQNSKFKRPDPPKNNRIGISWYYPHLQLCPKINTYKVSRNSLQTFKKNCVYQPRPTPHPPPPKKTTPTDGLTDWWTRGQKNYTPRNFVAQGKNRIFDFAVKQIKKSHASKIKMRKERRSYYSTFE